MLGPFQKLGRKLKGQSGGGWDANTHKELYGTNINNGLGDFIVNHVRPDNMLEFGAGLCGLANYIAARVALTQSFCLEPDVELLEPLEPDLNLLNVDVLADQPPRSLDSLFDLVLSIEVAEHVPRELHEKLFDFLVARAGRMIVFSAARQGQGGHGHVAERPELEWREEFTSRGCVFDPRLTLIARSMSNTRNINHRRNLQVFHAPDRSCRLVELEQRAKPYLIDLLSIILASGDDPTGNLFYVDVTSARAGRPEHALHWKRENFCALAEKAENILEIGFAAGHSALICLLANNHSKLTIVDPLEFAHSRGCFDYLNSMFPGRLKIRPGYSTDVLAKLPKRTFDLVHLDGGKEKTIRKDLALIEPLVARDHVLCIDDTQNAALNRVVKEATSTGMLDNRGFEPMNGVSSRARWTHAITRFGADSTRDTETIFEEMRSVFRGVDHPSIYTARDMPGRARAEYLIDAVGEVEARRLSGAFVEVGVAAGHSSVIGALAMSRYAPRDLYLYDTFAGFGPDLPDEVDHKGVSIRDYDLSKYSDETCSAASVRARVESSGVASERLFLIEGPGETTIPGMVPPKVAILRLDADLFDPTLTALQNLYDLVEPGGFVIVDDYGHWAGCAEAVDLFFSNRGVAFPGKEIDYTCYGWQK